MKIIGMIMIILFSSSLGLMVDNYKKRQIKYIDNLISSTTPETEEIFHQLMNDERLKKFDFDLNVENIPLSTEEYNRIKDFFAALGRYDVDCQLRYINEFIGYYKMLKQQYQEYYASHHKLYIAFGVLSGMVISIFLI